MQPQQGTAQAFFSTSRELGAPFIGPSGPICVDTGGMALYTSYYTRQLALRGPDGGGAELQQEGEKTVQQTVARRTVDYAGPYVTWFEVGATATLTAAARQAGAQAAQVAAVLYSVLHVTLPIMACLDRQQAAPSRNALQSPAVFGSHSWMCTLPSPGQPGQLSKRCA